MSSIHVRPSVTICKGDITKQTTSVIVNAAKESLMGGGGVDGAIHEAAGPDLLEYCRTETLGCMTGGVVETPAFNLRDNGGFHCGPISIYHTVGPRYSEHPEGVNALYLRACYVNCIELALYSRRSIAFPSISTGIYGFPVDKAAEIATKVAAEYVFTSRDRPALLREIRFVLFSDDDLILYTDAYARAVEHYLHQNSCS